MLLLARLSYVRYLYLVRRRKLRKGVPGALTVRCAGLKAINTSVNGMIHHTFHVIFGAINLREVVIESRVNPQLWKCVMSHRLQLHFIGYRTKAHLDEQILGVLDADRSNLEHPEAGLHDCKQAQAVEQGRHSAIRATMRRLNFCCGVIHGVVTQD